MKSLAEVIERGSKALGLSESLLDLDLSTENLEESLDDVIKHATTLKSMASNTTSSVSGLDKKRYTHDEYKDVLNTIRGKSRY